MKLKQPQAVSLAFDSHPEIDLSCEFVRRFYQHDFDWCLNVCDPQVRFYGSVQGVEALGVDQFRHQLENVVALSARGFVSQVETPNSPLVIGNVSIIMVRFIVASEPQSNALQADHKLSSFVWLVNDDGPKLLNVHESATTDGFRDPERHGINQITYQYAKTLLDQVIRRSAVSLRDVSGAIHYLSASEVIYIEASRQRTVVHCINESFMVRRGFKELVGEFGNGLVIVHRSYAVSPSHVKSMRADAVVMDDGSMIPIPYRKSAELRKKLSDAIGRTQP